MPRVGVAGLVALSIVAVIASLSKSRLPSQTPAGDEAGHRSVQGLPTTDELPAQPRRPHILLITIDTLRADHLGCYGYFRDTSPHLDALAREAIVFDGAVSPMATTFPTHVSIMTAVHPLEHGFTSNTRVIEASFVSSPELRTVAELLKERGYATAAFVSAAPVRDSTGLNAGFDSYSQPQVNDWKAQGMRPAEGTNEAFYTWLETRPDQPLFIWIHYYDPHWPYDPSPPYDSMFTTDGRLESWLSDRRIERTFPKWKSRTAADIHNDYDAEIRYMDDRIGELFDRLKGEGLWDNTVVVVTADHGEALGQHDWRGHGLIYGEQIDSPLIIRLPWDHPSQPGRLDVRMSLIDLFPTLFGLVGPPLDGLLAGQATGRDVLSDHRPPPAVFSQRVDRVGEWGPGLAFALTSKRWRYYHLTEGADRLFDLQEDPHELTDVVKQHPDVAAGMKVEIRQRIATYRARGRSLHEAVKGGNRKTTPDEQMRRDLEALGYVDVDEDADGP